MKLSNYIYILDFDENTSIIFNGVTMQFVTIPRSKRDVYVQSLKNMASQNNVSSPQYAFFLKKMRAGGFLLEDSVDENEIVKAEEEKYINSNRFQTIIIPTYNCNYSCWYCTQKHHETELTALDVKRIKRHICLYLTNRNIKSYTLCWFGGEPLMQKKEVLNISSFLYQWCMRHGIDFEGQMTSNGALLDKDTIVSLKFCHINHFQITLDGGRESHNKVKRDNGNKSSFDLILTNIKQLLEFNESASVTLRFNYSKKKLQELHLVEEVCQAIPQELRGRIRVDLERIWQTQGVEDIQNTELRPLLEQFAKNGFRLSYGGSFVPCYAEKEHFETIYYNGKVDFCDNYSEEQARGVIDENGETEWKTFPTFKQERNKQNSICQDCHYYPVCTAECPSKRDTRLSAGIPFKCPNGQLERIEYSILDYCSRCMLNSKYNNL